MNLDAWRADVSPAGKYKTGIADQLADGLKGTHIERETKHSFLFMDQLLELSIINFRIARKGSPPKLAYAANADLLADGIVTKKDLKRWTTGYDTDGEGWALLDQMKEYSSKTGRDFIRAVALLMSKCFGEVHTIWVWEIQEALVLNTHGYDKDMNPEYKNSIDKRIINQALEKVRN